MEADRTELSGRERQRLLGAVQDRLETETLGRNPNARKGQIVFCNQLLALVGERFGMVPFGLATPNSGPVLHSWAQLDLLEEVHLRTHSLPVLLVVMASPLVCSAQPQRKHFESKLAIQRNLPFSSGVLVGNTLYIAGTTGVGPENAKNPVNAEQEARSAMDQVKQVVERSGMTMDDIVSIQVFCTDLANYDAFNRVYKTYFHGKYPARAFVGVSKLLFGARYEVMGTAVKTKTGSRPTS